MLVRYSAAQKAAAEAAGTFIFVFAGAAAVIVNQWTGGLLGPAGVAAVHGVALAAAVSAFRPVSGGHVNPAVSLACAAAGRMTGRSALVYILAQLVGAVAPALAGAGGVSGRVGAGAQRGPR
ncbi:MAG: aquaporin, partial [Bacillota bacterium]